MTDPDLIRKLQIKPGQRLLLLNSPAGYLNRLGNLPPGIQLLLEPAGPVDWVQLFARNSHVLDQLDQEALGSLRSSGIFWACFPTKSAGFDTDLSRDIGREPLGKAGLRGRFP